MGVIGLGERRRGSNGADVGGQLLLGVVELSLDLLPLVLELVHVAYTAMYGVANPRIRLIYQ